ncbi:transcriptional regulator [Nakamurella silvestris]|nr:transcriptional regulator [Nakamurella silvestris]
MILAVFTCLRLGWWQWDRSQESSGTVQNTGYALLWPAFGAAFIYMWVRFLSLEKVKDEEEADDEQALAVAQGEFGPADFGAEEIPVAAQTPSEDPAEMAIGIVGEETYEDPQLVAYNRALAALAEEDQRRAK